MQSRKQNPKNSRSSTAVLLAMSLLLALLASIASADIPARIHYEGRLFDDEGAPLAGPVDITIGLWDAASGGSLLYGETHSAVTLDYGAFSLAIGEGTVTPEDPAFGVGLLNIEVFLEVNVDGDTLSPRQAMHPTAQAQVAASVPSVEADVSTLQTDVGTAQATANAANGAATTAQSTANAANTAAASATGAAASAQTAAATAQTTGDAAAARAQDALGYIGAPYILPQDVSNGWDDTLQIEMVADADGDPILGILRQELAMMDPIPVLDIVRCSGDDCDSTDRTEYLASGTEDSYMECTMWEWDEWAQEDVCMMEEMMFSSYYIYNVVLGVGGNDFPYFAYFDDYSGDFEFTACGNADCSAGNTSTTLVANACSTDNATVAGSDGFPVFAYHDCANDDLAVIKCNDAACSAKYGTIVDSDIGTASNYYASSIAILPSGNPVISYFDDSSDDLGLIVCNNANCSSSSSTILDSTGTVGRKSSLAIGSDGFPSISYWRSDTDDLKFLHCQDASCSSHTTETLVDDGTASGSTLRIDSDGNPVIAFHASPGVSADFIRCRTADCTTRDERRTLQGNVGGSVRMLLDPDEEPILAYSLGEDEEATLAYVSTHSDAIESNTSSASAASTAAGTAQSTANTANSAAASAQTAADAAQAAADAAQAAVDALDSSGCGTFYPIQSSACPFAAGDTAPYIAMPNCSDAQAGSLCEGDTECATDGNLDNCGNYDIYLKVSGS